MLLVCGCAWLMAWPAQGEEPPRGDVLVYGGTPAGIAAAIAAAKDGVHVLLIEPTARIGGLVTNGLSHTDFHSRESLSGAFLDFAKRVEAQYAADYGPQSPQVQQSEGGVFAEPKVNLQVFHAMLAEYPQLRLLTGHRLTSASLATAGDAADAAMRRIASVRVTNASGDTIDIPCKVAIDASYEGDLMAAAGVAWRVGREARDEYGESLAPEQADGQLQAYNFRFIMTKKPENRVAPTAPRGYRREDFVGVLAALNSGTIDHVFGYPSKCIFKAHLPPLPNEKYDINDVSRSLVRLSLPGKNLTWPDGDQAARQAVFDEHLRDQAGLLFFLQNDPEVPENFRQEARQWGWCRDEFEQTQHLPDQLYVREARRMVGAHIYTQRDSEHAPGDARAVLHMDSIAMGDYGNNCHGTSHSGPRFGGTHTGEFYNAVPPYQIPYGVLVPREVANLLVPTAASSSHVGFCGLRLEPIWMSLGQAAGHAAAWAEQHDTSVQRVAVRQLQHRLHQLGAATIYVSDVLPGHPDFAAVQWWGTLGGLHGLFPMPDKPGQRGAKLHGQYYAATPGHSADLDRVLDPRTAQRWKTVCVLAGLAESACPPVAAGTTQGNFIRRAFQAAEQAGLTLSSSPIPRLHPHALPNTHAPGEVENFELTKRVVADLQSLPGIVVDDVDAQLTGQWTYSTHTPPYVGRGYLHDMKEGKGEKSVRFTPELPKPGRYEVRLAHCWNIRRSTVVRVTVQHADGSTTVIVNQQVPPEHDQLFKTLGTFRFEAGKRGWVEITNERSDDGKVVIADAVQFLPK